MRLFDLFKKKPLLTFTREFPVVGTMTCEARSEKQCKLWRRRMDFCCWKNTLFTFGDDVDAPDKLSAMITQIERADKNRKRISDQIKTEARYQSLLAEGKDCLIPDNHADVQVTVRVTDDSGEVSPYVAVSYPSHGMYVWIAIQNGEVSAFTAEKE